MSESNGITLSGLRAGKQPWPTQAFGVEQEVQVVNTQDQAIQNEPPLFTEEGVQKYPPAQTIELPRDRLSLDCSAPVPRQRLSFNQAPPATKVDLGEQKAGLVRAEPVRTHTLSINQLASSSVSALSRGQPEPVEVKLEQLRATADQPRPPARHRLHLNSEQPAQPRHSTPKRSKIQLEPQRERAELENSRTVQHMSINYSTAPQPSVTAEKMTLEQGRGYLQE